MLGWLFICIVIDTAVIIANLAEQLSIMRKWKILDRIDHLFLSLSLSDLIAGLTTFLNDAWQINRVYTSVNRDTFVETDHVVATICDSVFIFSVFASLFHVVAIAVERFYAIKFPTKYYIFTTFKMKCATITTIWVLSVLLTPPISLFLMYPAYEEIGIYIRACVFGISVVFVLVIYSCISVLLFMQRKSVLHDFSPECNVQHGRLKRLTVLCSFIAISFVLCILPITVGYFDDRLLHPFASVMITLNSFINPCVYFIKVYYENRNEARSRSNTTTHALMESRGTVTMVTQDDADSNGNRSDRTESFN